MGGGMILAGVSTFAIGSVGQGSRMRSATTCIMQVQQTSFLISICYIFIVQQWFEWQKPFLKEYYLQTLKNC